ncbi:MAG: hemolysin family protein [Acidobacteriota bacterium]
MGEITFEIIFIILLVIANGIFALSEMAIVSARKTRLQQWASEGNRRAEAALELAVSPDRFLSTVQVGITLVGVLAGAFGGATISEQLSLRLKTMPAIARYSEAISVAVVVLSITYLSLVIGELVPKRLALTNPEKLAALVAKPMRWLSTLAYPMVYILGISTQTVFKLFGIKPSSEPAVTEEEIKIMIEQGTRAGVFEEKEQDLLESVLRLGDKRIRSLMTPRPEVIWLDNQASEEEIKRKIIASPYSRFPVCQGGLDKIIGMVKARDLLLSDEKFDLMRYVKQPLFVPENRSALQTLETFKHAHTHLALVIDEHGSIKGLVTTNDILEAIVGDIALASQQAKTYAVQREDGAWLLDGAIPIDEFKALFSVRKMPGEDRGTYQTLAGFIMLHLGRIPAVADIFEWDGLRFEILGMDRNRVNQVLVSSIQTR